MHSTPYLLNAVSSTTPSSSSTPSHFSTRAESSVTNTSSPSSLFHPGNSSSSSVVVENHPQVAPNNKHNTNADIDYLSCNLLPMRSSSVLVHSSSSSGGVEHEIHTQHSRSSTSTSSLSTLLEERCLIHESTSSIMCNNNNNNNYLESQSSCLKSMNNSNNNPNPTQKLQLLIPNNSFQMNNNNTSSPSPSQVSSCTFSFPNSPASSSSSSTTTTPKSNPSTPTTPNRLLNHFPPSQPRSLIEIHLKNNAFSSVVSQKSSTALKTTTTPPPNSTHASCTKTSFIMNNRTLTTTTTTTGIKKVTQSDHPSRKSCTSTTSKASHKQHPVSPSHHSQPLPASIHSFTLPPCVYTDSTTTTIVANTTTSCTDKNMFLHHHQVAPTTSSISTCTIQTHNLNNTMFSQATLVPSSFSNPASLWMKSESGGSSSPLKVPSPSRIHSNYIYSPFTYNFIKQNTPSRNNAKPKNAQQKSKSNETDDGEKQAIERLEAFYLKKSELLASHLLSKMDHFYRSLLSCIQDILLRLMDTSRTTQCDETVMKKLDRIQRMINLKKYISSRIKEFDEWPMFFDSCITQVSAEDLSRLEDIERCTNNFKVIITGKEELTKNLNLASLKTRLTDHQMFQYVTQFIATCCWVDRKAIPEDVMNCLQFFATIPTSDQVDLLKLAKKQDDHWTNRYDTPTLCSLQDLADSDDDVPMRDCTNAFSFTLM